MFNYDKLRSAIHYVCERNNVVGGTLDDVKLNKVLWYADSLTYMTRGQPITGTTYVRKPRGPVAKYHTKAINELLGSGSIREGKVNVDGDWRPTFDSTKAADKTGFSGADLQMLDRVYDYVNSVSSAKISEQSHGSVWNLARENEEIPLYTVFAENLGRVTAADIHEATADLRV